MSESGDPGYIIIYVWYTSKWYIRCAKNFPTVPDTYDMHTHTFLCNHALYSGIRSPKLYSIYTLVFFIKRLYLHVTNQSNRLITQRTTETEQRSSSQAYRINNSMARKNGCYLWRSNKKHTDQNESNSIQVRFKHVNPRWRKLLEWRCRTYIPYKWSFNPNTMYVYKSNQLNFLGNENLFLQVPAISKQRYQL